MISNYRRLENFVLTKQLQQIGFINYQIPAELSRLRREEPNKVIKMIRSW